MSVDPITVEVVVPVAPEAAWRAFTTPEAITAWNAASPDWHTPRATNDLRVGGKFVSRMEARDGSAGFDFEGTYEEVSPYECIRYVMDDGRKVSIVFTSVEGGTRVVETFDPETENSPEMQRTGWQAILDNYKKFVENSSPQ